MPISGIYESNHERRSMINSHLLEVSQIKQRINNLQFRIAEFSPKKEALSNYTVIAFFQTAYFKVIQLIFAKTIKKLKSSLNQEESLLEKNTGQIRDLEKKQALRNRLRHLLVMNWQNKQRQLTVKETPLSSKIGSFLGSFIPSSQVLAKMQQLIISSCQKRASNNGSNIDIINQPQDGVIQKTNLSKKVSRLALVGAFLPKIGTVAAVVTLVAFSMLNAPKPHDNFVIDASRVCNMSASNLDIGLYHLLCGFARPNIRF